MIIKCVLNACVLVDVRHRSCYPVISAHIRVQSGHFKHIVNFHYYIMFYCIHLNIKGSCRWSLKSLIWPWKNWKNGLMGIFLL